MVLFIAAFVLAYTWGVPAFRWATIEGFRIVPSKCLYSLSTSLLSAATWCLRAVLYSGLPLIGCITVIPTDQVTLIRQMMGSGMLCGLDVQTNRKDLKSNIGFCVLICSRIRSIDFSTLVAMGATVICVWLLTWSSGWRFFLLLVHGLSRQPPGFSGPSQRRFSSQLYLSHSALRLPKLPDKRFEPKCLVRGIGFLR